MSERSGRRRGKVRAAPPRPAGRLEALEALEGRVLLSTYTVTSTADVASTDPGYAGTLRWAIDQANAADAPASSPSLIGFAPSFFVPIRKTITLTQGQLELTQGATRIGGPSAGYLTVSGNNHSRIFLVDGGVTATVSGLTIGEGYGLANGSATGGGGACNLGTLTLVNCTLSNDTAYASYGGGVENAGGTLSLTGCTLSSDSASYLDLGILGAGGGNGGAVDCDGGTASLTNCTLTGDSGYQGGALSVTGGTASLTDCTLSNDTAGSLGGGAYNAGTLTLTDCTLSADSASNSSPSLGSAGGGAYTSGSLTLTNCTLTGDSATAGGGGGGGGVAADPGATLTLDDCTVSANSASYGGGIDTAAANSVTLNNTIVAADTSTASAGDVYVVTNSGGSFTGSNNLIGDGGNVPGLIDGFRGNRVGTTAHPVSPDLGTLQNNGGPTQTMALLAGSPALDAGSKALLPPGAAADQRGPGYARVYGPALDIGALEVQPTAPAPTVTGVTPEDPAGNGAAAGSSGGSGGQRSIISQLVVTFSESVHLAAGAFTLGLVNQYGSGTNDGSADTDASSVLAVPTNPSNDGLTWVIPVLQNGGDTTYSYNLGAAGGASLQDGAYHLAVSAAAVTASNGGAAMAAAYASPLFHRLFGDTDGNQTVNAIDYAAFKKTFGTSTGQAPYNADLDSDGNGTINAIDYAAFKKRFGLTFTYP